MTVGFQTCLDLSYAVYGGGNVSSIPDNWEQIDLDGNPLQKMITVKMYQQDLLALHITTSSMAAAATTSLWAEKILTPTSSKIMERIIAI